MSSRYAHPKWWQLYLTFLLLIVLLLMDIRLKLSVHEHQAVQIGIILLVYGLVHLWLKANATAMTNMDQRQFRGTVIITPVSKPQLPERKNDKGPMSQLHASEIKGILSDTFEMEIIDAEFFAVDEVSQELKKE